MVKLTIEECKETAFDIIIRIPSWAIDSKIMVNGSETNVAVTAGKYATINRIWKKGDTVVLEMPWKFK
ncbi:beta-L-arabinofuranosidase domain-containing protein [Cellulophaga sp. HaHa_2_1]|uniref:beta-L-arabinofuranosidase domain-containing protein n=1 Tax=Cellulophaga sp. HaHa_2_1 TaxID=2749994 RepID=UPI001C4F8016|nr:glycoside hydrolase family 127 protein [Cellulophaga sp. HaHa_2_1]